MTDELQALGDWLAAHGVSHVAMEATGVYWHPIYNCVPCALSANSVLAYHGGAAPTLALSYRVARLLPC